MRKETIISNFSKYAHTYDLYADVQNYAGRELLKRIKKRSADKILEIGCGTGNYTLLLSDKFTDARIKAIDISAKMLEVADRKINDKRITFIVSDAQTLSLKEKFDLITSNGCFQWLEDLDAALIRYKKALKKDGVILFSMFGPRTFWELNIALRQISKEVSIDAADFIGLKRIRQMLSQHFKQVTIEQSRYRESFPCLKDLLNKIKYMGIRGEGLNRRIFFSRQLLKKLEEFYLNKFKGIKATYQILLCRGFRV